jgi:hypothetical protein
MAQLRDKTTSQILHEGTPLECVTIARQLGLDKVIFDDVGLAFDPDAVWNTHQQSLTSWEDVASSSSVDEEGRQQAQQALQDLNQETADAQAQVPNVQARQEAIQAGDQVPPLP